jgi:outer membrane immunogenic protein
MRWVLFAGLVFVSLVSGGRAFAVEAAPSDEELQRRLAALESNNAKLEKENAALRSEMSHLKASKQVTRTQPEEHSLPASVRAAYAYAPMPAAPFNWTGFYVGAQSGYGLTQPNTTTTSSGGLDTPRPSGGFWGAQIGVNKQFAPGWLIGAEFEAAFARLEASQKGANPADGSELLAATIKLDSLMTLRGRFGFAADRNLFYLTGGFAWSEIEVAAGSGGGGLGGPVRSSYVNQTVPGWTVGGGIERALWDNWTGKIEYLYVRLDPIKSEQTSIQTNVHTFKVGVNYLFH